MKDVGKRHGTDGLKVEKLEMKIENNLDDSRCMGKSREEASSPITINSSSSSSKLLCRAAFNAAYSQTN